MMYLNVPNKNGINREKVYSVEEFKPPVVYDTRRKKKGKKEISYITSFFMTFDIETTSVMINDQPKAFMYHWQCCIDHNVIFGRTWEKFIALIEYLGERLELNENKRLVCYVHNLSFEFQFIKDFLQPDELFAKDAHKVLYYLSHGIEFRCSYFLSNMNLQKFCENSKLCFHFKMSGENYNYKKIRTCNTPLTEEESGYCFCDVAGLYECIETRLLEDDLTTIPLTSTGYVRRDYRKRMKNKRNRDLFLKLRLTPETYIMCKQAFRGGDTHANRYKVGYIIENVRSRDRQSSYPAVMNQPIFPMSPFTYVVPNSQEEFDNFIDNYACLINITIMGLENKIDQPCPYIDLAHCLKHSDIINDNGRVVSAKMINMTCTELDIKCIRMCYEYSCIKVEKMYIAKRGLLPVELREYLMELYDGKTQLKGVDGKEYEYAKKKNDVNSSFGMMVTAIDHDEVYYTSDTEKKWKIEKEDLEESLNNFYKSMNNFLSYQWGVWITAGARYELRLAVTEVANDFVYCDTDSVKYVEDHEDIFEKLNKRIIQEDENAFPVAYAEKNGDRYYLGVWEDDGQYKEFRTWGAKKYAYTDKKGFHITVAGMSKKKGAERIGCIEDFKITGEPLNDVGRQVAYYVEDVPHYMTYNGSKFLTSSSLALFDTTYTLGVSNTFRELLEKNFSEIYEKGIDRLM